MRQDKREETDVDTELTDPGTDIEGVGCDEEDPPDLNWFTREDNSEDEDEDYEDSTTLLLDMIEEQFNRHCKYVQKNSARTMQVISRHTLKAFLE
ncbi:MAG: hypothetical protein M1813_000861 [Trichoglossum hirsutum]|nr:MAG: hypothetical protein M1813_000861 [Trichoglossum hirsutum]